MNTPAKVAAAFLLLGLARCGGCMPPQPEGSLVITVLPAGAPGNITVTGPDGFQQTVTASATLDHLDAGSYLVSPATALSSDPIVSTVYLPVTAPASVTVVDNQSATAMVQYRRRGGTGMLWSIQAASPPGILGYSADQIRSDYWGPALAQTEAGTGTYLEAAVIDSQGSLWVSDLSASAIYKYTADQMDAFDGGVTPAVTISNPALNGPVGLAFDRTGGLWIAGDFNNAIAKYNNAYALDGSVTADPDVLMTNNPDGGEFNPDGGQDINGPTGLAFDSAGNLWIAGVESNAIVKYSGVASFTGDITVTPDIYLTNVTDGGLPIVVRPYALAFDQLGNLWITNYDGHNITKIPAASLTASGEVAAGTVIGRGDAGYSDPNDGGAMLSAPRALAFDNSGSLWVSNVDDTSSNGSGRILRFDNVAALGPGEQQPDASVMVNLVAGDWAGVAFNPPPPNVPIVP